MKKVQGERRLSFCKQMVRKMIIDELKMIRMNKDGQDEERL